MLGKTAYYYFPFKKDQKNNNNNNNNQKKKTNNRVLISIKVHGSAGPLRFLVNDDDLVSHVIKMTLKHYARQRRLPYLGFDTDDFLLYHPAKFHGLSPTETIGSCGGILGRELTLMKKNLNDDVVLKEKTRKQKLHFKWRSCFVIQSNSVVAS